MISKIIVFFQGKSSQGSFMIRQLSEILDIFLKFMLGGGRAYNLMPQATPEG